MVSVSRSAKAAKASICPLLCLATLSWASCARANAENTTPSQCPNLAEISQSPAFAGGDPAVEPAAMWAEHLAFRQRWNATLPEGFSRIAIHNVSAHLSFDRFSVILVRGNDGIWHGDGVSIHTITQLNATHTSHVGWTVTPEHSAQIDNILADRCFSAEPFRLNDASTVGVGENHRRIDIDTPQLRRSIEMIGLVQGLAGRLLNLATQDSVTATPIVP